MGLFDWLKSRREPPAGDVPDEFPWDRHPSIFEHVQAHIRPGQKGLANGGEELPDEEPIGTGSQVRWAAGAMDGVCSHHMGNQESEEPRRLLALVRNYWQSPTAKNKLAVYSFLVNKHVVSLIDPFIELISQEPSVNHNRLYELARSFATESPDREPVKFGLVLLGPLGDPADRGIFHALGRHDEFTLFCAVALSNADDGEEDLWELGKQVDGWGRIHVVERLAGTENPEIKEWLLREGFKNSVLFEYLAYSCAVGGGLLAALERPEVDDKLLSSAGELIQALIAGGPAQNIDDYDDGAAVIELYLEQMDRRASSLSDFLTADAIRRHLSDQNADWESRASRGWTSESREFLLKQCTAIIERPQWRELARNSLKSDDEQVFFNADRVATVLGIDVVPYHWDRLQKSPLQSGRWFNVMKGCTEDKVADVIALAETTLPLDHVATGPGLEMGLGPGFETHSCLDFILQELGRFPGRGIRLVLAGLSSPVIRNRNMALKAFSEWGRNNWPAELEAALAQARDIEPDDDVRRRIENVIAGKPLDEAIRA